MFTKIYSFHLRLSFLLVVFCSITFLFSCESTSGEKENSNLISTVNLAPKYSTPINLHRADSLIQFFHETKKDIGDNFLYTSKSGTQNKIMAFSMDSIIRDSFFSQLTKLTPLTQSVSIRINMALEVSNLIEANNSSVNFIPLLQFVVDNDSLIHPYYPLTGIDAPISWEDADTLTGDEPINFQKANLLVENWIHEPLDSVSQLLYTYKQNPSSTTDCEGKLTPKLPKSITTDTLVQYYVFGNDDTKLIYNHFLKLQDLNKTCYFHLHLGVCKQYDWIPLRNVIHLDERELKKGENKINLSNSSFFEFSMPCPKFCGDTLSNNIF